MYSNGKNWTRSNSRIKLALRGCQIITVPFRIKYTPSPLPSPRKRGEGDAKRRVRGAGWKMEQLFLNGP